MSIRGVQIICCLIIFLIPCPLQASGSNELDRVLDLVVNEVLAFLNGRNDAKILVDEVPAPRVGTGRVVTMKLRDRLRNRELLTNDWEDATYSLRGNMSFSNHREAPFVRLDFSLHNPNTGAELKSFRMRFWEATQVMWLDQKSQLEFALKNASDPELQRIKEAIEDVGQMEGAIILHPSEVAFLSGCTVDYQSPLEKALNRDFLGDSAKPATISIEDIKKAKRLVTTTLGEALGKPTYTAWPQANLSASEVSPFRIQIEVADSDFPSKFRPAPMKGIRGMALLELNPNAVYRVRIMNLSNSDVGAELRIDGINSLVFCTSDSVSRLGKYLVRKESQGLISGWQTDLERTEPFRVTSIPAPAISEIGSAPRMGTISVGIFPRESEHDSSAFVDLLDGRTKCPKNRGQAAILSEQELALTKEEVSFGRTPLAVMTVRFVYPDDF
ncbi:MAG: hypothetical protein KDA80_13230 [Planctomycetaceae bacterium]|nr:hypothetical protein [Planctomycetaceae bacterium]